MKRQLLIFIIIISLLPITPVYALECSQSYVFYEDFENEIFDFEAWQADAVHETSNTFGTSRGALKVDVKGGFGDVRFPVKFELGETYNFTARIRLDDAISDQWQFILRYDDQPSAYYEFPPSTSAISGEWVTITQSYTHNGYGSCYDPTVDTDGDGFAEVGLNAQLSLRVANASVSEFTYYMDEVAVEKITSVDDDISAGNIRLSAEMNDYGNIMLKAVSDGQMQGFYRFLRGDGTESDEMGCVRSGTVSGTSVSYKLQEDDFGSYFAFEIIPEQGSLKGQRQIIYTENVLDKSRIIKKEPWINSLNGEFSANPCYLTYNDFEVGKNQVKVSNGKIGLKHMIYDTYEGSNGALKVDYDPTGRAYIPIELEVDKSYRFSAKIKLDGEYDLNADRYAFVLEHENNAGCEFIVNGIEPSQEWQTITYDYTFKGTSYGTTEDGSYGVVQAEPKAIFSIRVGDGSEEVSYLIDDVYIENIENSDEKITAKDLSLCVVSENFGSPVLKGIYDSEHSVFYRVLSSADKSFNKFSTVSSGCTDKGEINYRISEKDFGKYFRVEITPFDGDVKGDSLYTDGGESLEIPYTVDVNHSEISESGEITVNVSVINYGESKQMSVFVAGYGKSGEFFGCGKTDATVEDDYTFSLTKNLTENVSYAKIMVLNKKSIMPYITAITVTRDNIYVDGERGDDSNSGSKDEPFKTIERAKQEIRNKKNNNMNGDITVYIKNGTYTLTHPLEFTQEDSGVGDNNVIYKGYGDGEVIIDGGMHVNGEWTLYDATKNIYRTYVGTNINTRQLFVNGLRATRARSEAGLSGAEENPVITDSTGHISTDTFIADLEHPEDLEFVYYCAWTNPRCGVESVEKLTDDTIRIIMEQPGWKSLTNKDNLSITKGPDYYENAYELIDRAGEWYLNKHDGYLYYKPHSFENMETADFVLPVVEKLIDIKGESAGNRAENIHFENITFKYSTWLRPSTSMGHSDAQDNVLRYLSDDGTEMIDTVVDGAIEIELARNIDFTKCKFSKLGTTAIRMVDAVSDSDISLCEFFDLSASAIQIGDIKWDDYSNPSDNRKIMRNNNITNNYFRNIPQEYHSAAVISAGYPSHSNISNNEIFDASYSGIHVCWGWNNQKSVIENFVINKNYIHEILNDKLKDGGGIYFCGGTACNDNYPNIVKENYIQNQHDIFAMLYADYGTTGISYMNNVMDNSGSDSKGVYWFMGNSTLGIMEGLKFTDNYTNIFNPTDSGIVDLTSTNYVFDGNWNESAKSIIENAGIEDEYKELFPNHLQILEADDYLFLVPNESYTIELTGKTRKDVSYDLSNVLIEYESSDNNVATVDEEGCVTAVSNGTATITVYAVENGFCIKKDISVIVTSDEESTYVFKCDFETDGDIDDFELSNTQCTIENTDTYLNSNGSGRVKYTNNDGRLIKSINLKNNTTYEFGVAMKVMNTPISNPNLRLVVLFIDESGGLSGYTDYPLSIVPTKEWGYYTFKWEFDITQQNNGGVPVNPENAKFFIRVGHSGENSTMEYLIDDLYIRQLDNY